MSHSYEPSASLSTPQKEVQPGMSNMPESPEQHYDDPKGLHLQVNFSWSKFKNIVSKVDGEELTPIYIQHFRPTKPQLRFILASDEANTIATGTINNVSISAECTIGTHTIPLEPLSRLKTKYNYLSHAITSDSSTPTPITWIATCSLKIWDFICLGENQLPIAKFSVNWWAIKQVGNFYFADSIVRNEVRDEIVVTGLTLLYVMTTRMNNPLNLVGAMTAKPGRVDGKSEEVEMEDRKKK